MSKPTIEAQLAAVKEDYSILKASFDDQTLASADLSKKISEVEAQLKKANEDKSSLEKALIAVDEENKKLKAALEKSDKKASLEASRILAAVGAEPLPDSPDDEAAAKGAIKNNAKKEPSTALRGWCQRSTDLYASGKI